MRDCILDGCREGERGHEHPLLVKISVIDKSPPLHHKIKKFAGSHLKWMEFKNTQ